MLSLVGFFVDNSHYLRRWFYNSFAVSSACIRSLFAVRVSGDSPHSAQIRMRQKNKIETKHDQFNSIPNEILPISLGDRRRLKAPLRLTIRFDKLEITR